ncbi:MAG TPA: trehalose-6-phosphate synthase [Pseudomonadota bacterium]|nr:trehalose-6-phosphate synthase [Pseudomonadota bacterium]
MRLTWKFLLGLLVGLALLTWSADELMQRTLWHWTERDLQLRGDLALRGARRSLLAAWQAKNYQNIRDALSELTRDERLLAAATCGLSSDEHVQTEELPTQLSCSRILPQLLRNPTPFREVVPLESGRVHLTVLPLSSEQEQIAVVLLVHDLSFLDRREAASRRFLLLISALLAVSASLLTLLTARGLWRKWTDSLRAQLSGTAADAEFAPVAADVRELIGQLMREREQGEREGRWSPHRLKQILTDVLHGEQVLLLANREPYIHNRTESGEIQVLHPASGLVTALEPVMRACSGVWIAHGSGSADRETADDRGRLSVPPESPTYWLRRVWLSAGEEQGYYFGFANEGLWALCHLAHNRPEFRATDFATYLAVNERFAAAVCEEAECEDPLILVQDYHFALAPAMIRRRLPRATIITFWHIPWPNAERFGICPWHREILSGLLGSSIVGFHTQAHCNNFLQAVDRFLEARIDRESDAVVRNGKTTLVRPYPISIAWPNPWVEQAPPVEQCRASVREELSLPADALIGLGVDRIDYTKGIEERLLAVEALLDAHPEFVGRFVFVQLGAPSRTAIPHYRALNERLDDLALRLNQKFQRPRYQPIVFARSHHEPATVFRYYRAAEFCYVSSLHDGMNLVAKEFVAARDDEQGVLILSQFTGAARELTDALIVNPYDITQTHGAMYSALTMPKEIQHARMRAMRSLVAEFNVYRWAGRMLLEAARLRERERLNQRIRPGETAKQPSYSGSGGP